MSVDTALSPPGRGITEERPAAAAFRMVRAA